VIPWRLVIGLNLDCQFRIEIPGILAMTDLQINASRLNFFDVFAAFGIDCIHGTFVAFGQATCYRVTSSSAPPTTAPDTVVREAPSVLP
jgi:hypothetical protein